MLFADRRFVPDDGRHGSVKPAFARAPDGREPPAGFEKGEDAQKSRSESIEPFPLGDIPFGPRQDSAENVAGQIKPLERGGARKTPRI